ncbi:MAG TPA: hypothetical protein VKI62_01900 [Bacteroidota bacterium]|nr:hypothetical protein [Bacteroidota bacterium]
MEPPYPHGFTTSFGRALYYSSFTKYQSANYDFTVGFGFNISPQFLVGIKIYTGEENSATDQTQPVSGKFDLGGGAILLTYRLIDHGKWRPFITAGYELSTILTGAPQNTSFGSLAVTGTSGYTGSGLHSYIGTECYLSENFSFEGSFSYQYRQYTSLIINSNNLGNVVSFTDQSFGVTLGCNVYFNLLP